MAQGIVTRASSTTCAVYKEDCESWWLYSSLVGTPVLQEREGVSVADLGF